MRDWTVVEATVYSVRGSISVSCGLRNLADVASLYVLLPLFLSFVIDVIHLTGYGPVTLSSARIPTPVVGYLSYRHASPRQKQQQHPQRLH